MRDEVDFLLADKHESFLQVDSITLGVRCQVSQSTQNSKFPISLQYLKENVKDKVDFYMQINIESFFKSILSFYVFVTTHAQITQSNKFAISLQYLKQEVSDEVDFLHVDMHGNFLQIDTMMFDGDGQAFSKFQKWQVCNVFTVFQKRS